MHWVTVVAFKVAAVPDTVSRSEGALQVSEMLQEPQVAFVSAACGL